ncbi:MAG: hypothetical protein IPL35_12555 [Sphingobacteriales bacterium]|nr:hypothetical protein [Sphingobacteriales bacterium]
MNAAHYHLIFNHFPIFFHLIGFLVLIGGISTASAIIKRTAYCLFIAGTLFTFAANASGERAEHWLDDQGRIEEKYVEEHEEAAEAFMLSSIGLGLLAAVALWANYKRRSFANTLSIVTVLYAAIVLFLAQRVGNSGGEIMHPEIRENYTPKTIAPTGTSESHENEEH